jgi:hypothetical protein
MTYALKTHGLIRTDAGAAVGGNAELFEVDSSHAIIGNALATAALGVLTGMWELSYASADPTKDYIVQISPTSTSNQKRYVLMTNEHTQRELTVISTATMLGATNIAGNLAVTGTLVVTGAATIKSTIDITGTSTFRGAITATAASFTSVNESVNGIILLTKLPGDASRRFTLYADGDMDWGDGTGPDTTLYRSAAHTLKTDDSFHVNANLAVTGTATVTGAVSLISTLDVTGALAVTGAAVLRSTLGVAGALTVTGNATLRGSVIVGSSTKYMHESLGTLYWENDGGATALNIGPYTASRVTDTGYLAAYVNGQTYAILARLV